MRSPHTSYRWRGESHRANQVYASPHTSYRWEEKVPIKWMRSPHQLQVERVIEPIKWMRSPHTSYRWRGERVIEPIKCMRSPHTSYRWRERERHRANQVYAHHTQLQVERRENRANQVYALHTPATGGEERDIEPIKYALTTHQLQVERRESHRANQVYASTHSYRWRERERHRANQVCAHHTPATGGEERVMCKSSLCVPPKPVR